MSEGPITQALRSGNEEEVFRLAYAELERLAQSSRRREQEHLTLSTRDLLHEAFLRLPRERLVEARSRRLLFKAFAEALKRVLVDHARKKKSKKRWHVREQEPLDQLLTSVEGVHESSILDLDDGLSSLRERNDARYWVVLLRFFGNLTVDETAAVLGISTTAVDKHWAVARAWLYGRLSEE